MKLKSVDIKSRPEERKMDNKQQRNDRPNNTKMRLKETKHCPMIMIILICGCQIAISYFSFNRRISCTKPQKMLY